MSTMTLRNQSFDFDVVKKKSPLKRYPSLEIDEINLKNMTEATSVNYRIIKDKCLYELEISKFVEKEHIIIKQIYYFREDGSFESHDIIQHKIQLIQHKHSNTLMKIVGVTMGWITITPVKVFAKEMTELHKENTGVKVIISTFLALVTMWAGFPLVNVIGGLTIMAVLDAVFSLIPGAVLAGTEVDHRLQAKLWAFLINFGGIIFSSVASNVYLSLGSNALAKTIVCYINYVVAFWLVTIYVIRVMKYIARVNNVSVPWFVKILAKTNDKGPGAEQ